MTVCAFQRYCFQEIRISWNSGNDSDWLAYNWLFTLGLWHKGSTSAIPQATVKAKTASEEVYRKDELEFATTRQTWIGKRCFGYKVRERDVD